MHSAPHDISDVNPSQPNGAWWTWAVISLNAVALIVLLILSVLPFPGEWVRRLFSLSMSWALLGVPTSSIFVAVFCLTVDRGATRKWTRVAICAAYLIAPLLLFLLLLALPF